MLSLYLLILQSSMAVLGAGVAAAAAAWLWIRLWQAQKRYLADHALVLHLCFGTGSGMALASIPSVRLCGFVKIAI